MLCVSVKMCLLDDKSNLFLLVWIQMNVSINLMCFDVIFQCDLMSNLREEKKEKIK